MTVHHDEEYHMETKTTPAYDEKKLVKEAWDEEVVTDQKCSGCGKTKQHPPFD